MREIQADLIIVGASAAGLMSAIIAGRTAPQLNIVIFEGAKKLGAKILVAGGGRCNVTHHEVDASAYAGASPNAINKVLRRFTVANTTRFFADLGVALKREETGKLFPVSDDARTVLNALVDEAQRVGVKILKEHRVESISTDQNEFHLRGEWGTARAKRIILCTGGKSLPKSGSDGAGYSFATTLGHSLTPHIFPALVPLILPQNHFIRAISGITLPTTLTVKNGNGKHLISFTNSTLCTHFGLSGPSVLDISRHYTAAKIDDPHTSLIINWLPHTHSDAFEQQVLQAQNLPIQKLLSPHLPDRLMKALCIHAGLDVQTPCNQLKRDERKQFVQTVTALPLPIVGDRGYTYAEVTGGGIPLNEIHLDRMESRLQAGLFFAGEILDVDGRIGGFNFQWAWASGYVAGTSAVQAL